MSEGWRERLEEFYPCQEGISPMLLEDIRAALAEVDRLDKAAWDISAQCIRITTRAERAEAANKKWQGDYFNLTAAHEKLEAERDALRAAGEKLSAALDSWTRGEMGWNAANKALDAWREAVK